jgi:hypothetical protein
VSRERHSRVERLPRICFEHPHRGLRVKAIDGWGLILTCWQRSPEGEVVTQFTLDPHEVDQLHAFIEDPGV